MQSNPLAQVMKHTEGDRSLQQDRIAGPSSSRVRLRCPCAIAGRLTSHNSFIISRGRPQVRPVNETLNLFVSSSTNPPRLREPFLELRGLYHPLLHSRWRIPAPLTNSSGKAGRIPRRRLISDLFNTSNPKEIPVGPWSSTSLDNWPRDQPYNANKTSPHSKTVRDCRLRL